MVAKYVAKLYTPKPGSGDIYVIWECILYWGISLAELAKFSYTSKLWEKEPFISFLCAYNFSLTTQIH